MTLKQSIRKLSRAFSAKDDKAFDEALEDLEDKLDEAGKDAEPEERLVEIHNHIPAELLSAPKDEAVAEAPQKAGEAAADEEPGWFKAYREASDARFASLTDSISALEKWAAEEAKEPQHADANLNMDGAACGDAGEEEAKKAEAPNADEAILGELEFEAPVGATGDSIRAAKDSALLEETFQDVVSKAEVIAPGLTLPTFDRKASPIATTRVIMALRKTALDAAYAKGGSREVIEEALSGRTLDTKALSNCASRVLFNAVASVVARSNNSRATDRSSAASDKGQRPAGIQSLAEINARNKARYGRVSG